MSNKSVFWQALIFAGLIFWVGILIGVYFESNRIEEIKNLFMDSETKVSDLQLYSNILFSENRSCQEFLEKSSEFADQIYAEAMKLEKYDASNQITGEMISVHRKYDFLRALLWYETIKRQESCKNMNIIVYLYQYDNPSIVAKGTQGAMSNYLTDIKIKYGKRVLVIPFAANLDLSSVDLLRKKYNLENIPVILVNNRQKFESVESIKDIEKYLN